MSENEAKEKQDFIKMSDWALGLNAKEFKVLFENTFFNFLNNSKDNPSLLTGMASTFKQMRDVYDHDAFVNPSVIEKCCSSKGKHPVALFKGKVTAPISIYWGLLCNAYTNENSTLPNSAVETITKEDLYLPSFNPYIGRTVYLIQDDYGSCTMAMGHPYSSEEKQKIFIDFIFKFEIDSYKKQDSINIDICAILKDFIQHGFSYNHIFLGPLWGRRSSSYVLIQQLEQEGFNLTECHHDDDNIKSGSFREDLYKGNILINYYKPFFEELEKLRYNENRSHKYTYDDSCFDVVDAVIDLVFLIRKTITSGIPVNYLDQLSNAENALRMHDTLKRK